MRDSRVTNTRGASGWGSLVRFGGHVEWVCAARCVRLCVCLIVSVSPASPSVQ